MKCLVIFYHKNIDKIYEMAWINSCIESIRKQTFQNFDVLELNYGNDNKTYCKGLGKNHLILDASFDNHIEAMNHLIEVALKSNYDVIFNTNMDDFYAVNRFEKQIEAIKQGYQLVASNFHYFTGENKHIKEMNMTRCGDIEMNLRRNHNVIAHPVVAYHKSFFDTGLKYNNLLGYEDLNLWQRAISQGKRFKILNDYLLNYRIHSNQVTQTYKGI